MRDTNLSPGQVLYLQDLEYLSIGEKSDLILGLIDLEVLLTNDDLKAIQDL